MFKPWSEREPRGERERQPLTQRLPDLLAGHRAAGRPARHRAARSSQGVLQDVLGEARIAQDPPSDPEERGADLVLQACERLLIGRASSLDEVSVHPTIGCEPGPMDPVYS